jgi:hypothetical protein
MPDLSQPLAHNRRDFVIWPERHGSSNRNGIRITNYQLQIPSIDAPAFVPYSVESAHIDSEFPPAPQ